MHTLQFNNVAHKKKQELNQTAKAKWLKLLTRNQMESSCESSDLADCEYFPSPVFNTSNRQKVRNKERGNSLRKRKKVTQQFKMEWPTPIILRESDNIIAECVEAVWVEPRWVRPAEVRIFSTEIFRSTLFNSSTDPKHPINGIYILPCESKSSHSSSTINVAHTKKMLQLPHAAMAKWLKLPTRNQMESSCTSSNIADYESFHSPVFNTSNRQKVRNKEKEVIPWERGRRSHNSSRWNDRHR